MRLEWILVALAGCGGGDFGGGAVDPDSGALVGVSRVCTENDTRECVCVGGAKGAQTCGSDGQWAKCECAVPTSDSGVGGGVDATTNRCLDVRAATCRTKCTGTCDSPTYNGACTTGCSSNFAGSCDGTCKGSCDGVGIEGACFGRCTGSCDGIANGSCASRCTGTVDSVTCAGLCTGQCCP